MSLATASRNWVSSGMLDYLIILLMGLLGFEGGGWWVILIGAVGLTLGSCFQLYELLKQRPAVQLDWHIVSYFAASFATNIAVCSASYLVGYLGHLLMG